MALMEIGQTLVTVAPHNYRHRCYANHRYIGSLFKAVRPDGARGIRAGYSDGVAPAVDGVFKTRKAAVSFLVEAARQRGDLA